MALAPGEFFAPSELAHSSLQFWALRAADTKILSTLVAEGLGSLMDHFHGAKNKVIAQLA